MYPGTCITVIYNNKGYGWAHAALDMLQIVIECTKSNLTTHTQVNNVAGCSERVYESACSRANACATERHRAPLEPHSEPYRVDSEPTEPLKGSIKAH